MDLRAPPFLSEPLPRLPPLQSGLHPLTLHLFPGLGFTCVWAVLPKPEKRQVGPGVSTEVWPPSASWVWTQVVGAGGCQNGVESVLLGHHRDFHLPRTRNCPPNLFLSYPAPSTLCSGKFSPSFYSP